MTVQPEFSRRLVLAEIGSSAKPTAIEATGPECLALARRFGLVSLESLTARAEIVAVAKGIEVRGELSARFTQSCAATAQPLMQAIDEPFHIRFEAPEGVAPGEELEVQPEECDIMEHDGLAIDLGEAVAQTLGLAINPFPRAPDADEVLKAAGILGEQDASPFAKLKGLFGKE